MLVVNKPIGWTSNQLIDYIKNNFNEFKNSKNLMLKIRSMAHGLMILLIDDECKRQMNLFVKIYKSQIPLGITTDTYDILGIPKLYENNINNINYDSQKIKNVINPLLVIIINIIKIILLFVKSYITNERKPLWKWSKENRLNEIIIPKKLVNIYRYIDDINIITSKELLDIILNKITLLTQGN